MAQVSLKAIKKNYGATQVIKGVDIEIGDGEFVVFVGPSGCGKSTLLRMIAGLEDISGGTLTIGDTVVNDLPPKDRRIAMVFQSYAIFPHMTVRENLAFGLTIANAPQAEKDAKVAEAARILQMEHLLDRRPSQLSGGQRQRVAIGRAIVRKPAVFLFDEPLSNLDAALRVDMRMELSKLHADLGATMVYVTHDQVEAMTLADKIVVLNGGVVQQIGTPLELYHTPANLFVAGFMGSPKMNLLKARIEAIGPDSVTVTSQDLGSMVLPRTNPELKLGDDVTVGLRPHHLGETGDHRIEGRIVLVERLGNETLAAMQLKSGQQIIAALPGDVAVAAGETLSLATQADKASLFLPSGDAA
ncbi:sn-glycerol-3-phosphate ABC transporter ATP-binding protein UgpC [Devosia sp. J2-20]|jgi:multiple sugar transport system ATP-binding protein|uniref:Sn-glycerol-3-phosphate ABC transporter ATP-binding protein UgpC n=1 Tax=Devosia litorisediminis TaxID=2829817 RepID=A0A942E8S4_9HYPH|nr:MULTISPECIES: sn-glycerol-3-phosphate ABC transporter ATP-binding protein UgpC [Devosia]MBS3850190.1 sn-glycerol-3-phosphate ABC transporter ATP-binding protein UgpC [Devosia litorisediminis]WDQ99958.1 sn-glycerol-3-phosphate ABC transporter ATP-binding protein UgpC [Devosia sp. J2-20]